MKPEDVRFEVELHLTTGKIVRYHVDQAYVDVTLKRAWGWPTEFSEDEKGFSVIFSEVANRLSKGSGFLQANDLDGRVWLVRADMIAAFNVRPYQKTAPRLIGFNPLVTEISADRSTPVPVVGIRTTRRG
jgi:hypothetical protein